jgi:hypothetical protein
MAEFEPSGETGVPSIEAQPMNFVQRLGGVFFEPKKTFEDINRKPSWFGIFLILCALVLVSMYVLQTRMDHETYMRKALQMNAFTRNLPEEQVQKIVTQPQGAFQRYSQYVFAPVGVLLTYLVTAGVLLLIFVLLGAAITFKKSLAVAIWGMAPPGIVVTLLGILFMYVKDPETLDLNPAQNIASNLGMLVSSKEHPALSSLLSSLDLFSFWTIFLLATGYVAISDRKLTMGKAVAAIVAMWAIWVLGKAGFMAFWG